MVADYQSQTSGSGAFKHVRVLDGIVYAHNIHDAIQIVDEAILALTDLDLNDRQRKAAGLNAQFSLSYLKGALYAYEGTPA
ncbi:hypothetical protein Q9292_09980 [Methylophilus sp. VKM B-3414]|uniref:hypothetical protein n=1 Tax=Methylophilus sp. VKM B-3414 TaxID=3076121 RepID=UPI0028C80D84|nr:hypothetical protein [Methylophilus sp. VKM B-3414]MDT7849939.1 hypothetical protein [Methylophilus sp. VKM B-3414]